MLGVVRLPGNHYGFIVVVQSAKHAVEKPCMRPHRINEHSRVGNGVEIIASLLSVQAASRHAVREPNLERNTEILVSAKQKTGRDLQ